MASVGEHCPQGPPRGAGRSEAEQRAALSFEATDTTNPAEGCRGERSFTRSRGPRCANGSRPRQTQISFFLRVLGATRWATGILLISRSWQVFTSPADGK